ncbi:MAG: MarR family transcriptional regulator [Betaproteobacteria bacterium]|nr:MAG: MarR family transcriptional regulator [Betaproteobacteria bacterium]
MQPIYDIETFRPSQGVGAFIGRARRTIVEAIDQELAPLDISHAQWIVVMLLGDGVASTAAELCKILIYDPGAMTRLLDRLEKKGVLRRMRTKGERRSVRLELTAEGRKLYPRILQALVQVFNRLLRGFGKKEVQQLEGLLQRMVANA